METHKGSGSPASTDPVPYAASGLPGQSSSLVDMLHRINELDVIPQLQVGQSGAAQCTSSTGTGTIMVPNSTPSHVPSHSKTNAEVATPAALTSAPGHQQCLTSPLTSSQATDMQTDTSEDDKSFPRAGRPRIHPPRERNEWHYHLGGVRHCRVPLNPELKEVLEVAYVSRIMSKNFRKEGQPEKERIANITGMDIDKVQEWFKNRRKKDRLLQDRAMGRNLPKCHRGRKSTSSQISVPEQQNKHTIATTSSSGVVHLVSTLDHESFLQDSTATCIS